MPVGVVKDTGVVEFENVIGELGVEEPNDGVTSVPPVDIGTLALLFTVEVRTLVRVNVDDESSSVHVVV